MNDKPVVGREFWKGALIGLAFSLLFWIGLGAILWWIFR